MARRTKKPPQSGKVENPPKRGVYGLIPYAAVTFKWRPQFQKFQTKTATRNPDDIFLFADTPE